MKKLTAIILFLVLIFYTFSFLVNAEEAQHQDLIEAMNSGQGTGPNRIAEHLPKDGFLTLKSGKYKLLLGPTSEAYEIDSLYYGDFKFIQMGVNGTVLLTKKGHQTSCKPIKDKTINGDPWIGGGHGGEIVHNVTCTVDGKKQPVQTKTVISGNRIVVKKTSRLYKFINHSTFILTPDGLTEHKEFKVIEEFDDLHYLYFYMHNWPASADKWLAGYHDGSEESGEFGTENKSIQLSEKKQWKQQPHWIAQYDPKMKMGAILYAPQPFPGHGLIQVRNKGFTYYKHYTVLPIRGRVFKPGDILKYSMVCKVIEDETGDWSATRKTVAELKNLKKED